MDRKKWLAITKISHVIRSDIFHKKPRGKVLAPSTLAPQHLLGTSAPAQHLFGTSAPTQHLLSTYGC
jgi:hypothetical protein